ncbi:MAG: DUF58 domain-containing protein [Mariprofundaceae bacterium]|nr:DUF58 domain-containing protein [Mariprofundaceae bacterium]
MAYNPSDLRLPPWILYLLDALIAVRVPIGRYWHIGMTRAGALMFFSLLGLWAAAFYSGNNLLYLCGAMLTAIAMMALWQGVQLLRGLPLFGAYLPDFVEQCRPVVLRQDISDIARSTVSGLVDITWSEADLQLSARICAATRVQGDPRRHGDSNVQPNQSRLIAQLQSSKRCYHKLTKQRLTTSAPLGLWELTYQRQDLAIWAVLPQAVAGLRVQGLGQNLQHRIEGDEYHDLRMYTPGDPLARIHWRKSTLDPSTWRIKRFSQAEEQPQKAHLRVDLRLPSGATQAAFENLLGLTWHWLQSQPESTSRGHQSQLILGQQCFDCSQSDGRKAAIHAIAAALPEHHAPKHGAGFLLSLVEP